MGASSEEKAGTTHGIKQFDVGLNEGGVRVVANSNTSPGHKTQIVVKVVTKKFPQNIVRSSQSQTQTVRVAIASARSWAARRAARDCRHTQSNRIVAPPPDCSAAKMSIKEKAGLASASKCVGLAQHPLSDRGSWWGIGFPASLNSVV